MCLLFTGFEFTLLKGERRLYSAFLSMGAAIEKTPSGSLRNGFAPLDRLSWAMGEMSLSAYREQWPVGEILGESESRPKRLARPMSGFFASPWVREDWLMGRIAGGDPSSAWLPLDEPPRASYLIWLP